MPSNSALDVRNHIHAIVGLAERIVSETDDALASELAAAICHQSRFLLTDPRSDLTEAAASPLSPAHLEGPDAAEQPADAGESPADAGENPADAGENPADAVENPADAVETPVDAGEQPADAVADSVQVVDESVLVTLADEIGSPDIVGTLVETFLGELDERITAILDGVDARGEEACRAAHTLKGTAATMGAVELTEISATLEHQFRSGEGEPGPVAARLPAAGLRCREALAAVVTSMNVPS